MNLTDILTPQARLRVYRVIAWVGLALAAFGAGLGSLAAFNIVVPLGVLAGYAVAGAVYSTVAGAFGFVAKANTPTEDTNKVNLVETDAAKVAELFARIENREDKEAMLGELTEQNVRDIQDTITAVPTQDQYQPGGVALTVEDEDEDEDA